GQSTSINTEGVAVFESCSAYHNPTRQSGDTAVIFLSHCVPNPPDKGEKIRAHHELNHIARRHPVHLICFARQEYELEAALELKDRCASIYVEMLPSAALAKAFG